VFDIDFFNDIDQAIHCNDSIIDIFDSGHLHLSVVKYFHVDIDILGSEDLDDRRGLVVKSLHFRAIRVGVVGIRVFPFVGRSTF